MPYPTLENRLSLREMPSQPTVMFQEWRKMLFLHWRMAPETIQPLLPPGLSVDSFEGRAWMGVVPFYMRQVRPRFLPAVPGISNFLELNIRTYVFDENGTPGVWFFSLDANSRIACTLGRSLFKLAYRNARMRAEEDGDWIRYAARRIGEDGTARFQYRGRGPTGSAEPGSLEFFLVERYLLFSFNPATDRLFRGRIHHDPYEYRDAEVPDYSDLPGRWNGIPMPGGPPDHAAFADGVKVRIFGLERNDAPGSPPAEQVTCQVMNDQNKGGSEHSEHDLPLS